MSPEIPRVGCAAGKAEATLPYGEKRRASRAERKLRRDALVLSSASMGTSRVFGTCTSSAGRSAR